MQKDDGMTEKYTTNLAEVAVSLGALQSSSMPITELNNPMTPLRDSDLPPTAACLLTSVSRECPEGEGIGLSMPEKPRMEGGDARGVDRGSFSNDLRLWILKKKKGLSGALGVLEKSARRGTTMENQTPQGWGRERMR